ncbi:MAG: branched-chain amino acid transport system ATP-binding protein [Pseudonocardiales bacterium]|nr:branched-chain amino acid transport system ATP-binding protein [Pseudonocardiales bacterium]
MLSVSDLEVRYGKVRALRGVHLTVPDGGSVAILGPNGAGKTSLLRAISGAVRPASGKVVWDGEDVAGRPAFRIVRAGVAHVPEGRAVIAPLSVHENLLMGAYAAKGRATGERLEQMLDLFPSLRRRLKIASGRLSGGEQQMLAIARGLMSHPRLIAIDEPSMGLAPAVADVVLNGLRRVHELGTAVLLVEQNAALALRMAHDVVLLSHGEVQRSGPASELADEVMLHYAD